MAKFELIFAIICFVVSLTMMLVKVDISINIIDPKALNDKRIKCDDYAYKKAHQNDRRTNYPCR